MEMEIEMEIRIESGSGNVETVSNVTFNIPWTWDRGSSESERSNDVPQRVG